jgi:uncharacterized protein
MRVEVVSSIADVPGTDWDQMAGALGMYSSVDWLRVVEDGGCDECRYLLVYDADRVIGALPAYLMSDEPNDYYNLRSIFRNLPPPAEGGRECLAGNRRGYRNEILLADGLPEVKQITVVRALIDELAELAGSAGSSHAAFLYLSEAGLQQIGKGVPGAQPVLSYSGDAWLDAPGESFDDYLAGLSSKQRLTVRNEMKRFTACGLRVSTEHPADHATVLAELAGNVQEKYSGGPGRRELTAALDRQHELLGDHGILFACRDDVGIIGVALAYRWQNWLYMQVAGFDYGRLPGAFEYFNVAIYEPLLYCYQHGLRGVHLGTGSHQAKALRGARIGPLASIALPVDGTGSTDPAPAATRRGVRRYWEQQIAAMPRYLDKDRWMPLLDSCWPP